MPVIAGIDEAGYGPRLGPLVVAATAIRFQPESAPASPRLWSDLSAAVQDRPNRGDDRLVIGDSKKIWRGGKGLRHVERSCLSFMLAGGTEVVDFPGLLRETLVQDALSEDGPPWDRPQTVSLPLAAEVEGVRQGAERLKTAASNLGATCAGISVNVAPPTRFNRLLDMTDNKADALFLLTAEVLAHLFRKFDGEPIIITMDKQGGRDYYGPLLARAFPDMHLAVEKESPGESRYTLTGNGRVVRLSIARGGEDRSLAVALASMTAKYVRELFMRQLNAFFSRLLPDLRPTAGYWVDAGRFLQETAEVARSLDIPDSAWVRSR